ncbi:N-substituted formamide deformylase precursor [Phycisphaerae bacterium RAS1]|nr:N-substituted formamide deformylase precursor [Phycisphaerae bacterium RAS1]
MTNREGRMPNVECRMPNGARLRCARRSLLAALSIFAIRHSTFALAAPPPDKIALTNVRIIPVVGAPIGKGTLLIENGKIAAVGEKVETPFDARVFDLAGKVLFPGSFIADTWRGLDGANESRPVTPQLDAYDAIDPSQLFFEDCLRLGTTAVHVMPGNNTVIGGLGRVVRPIGLVPDEMMLADAAFAKIAVTPKFGHDRMLQLSMLREAFAELDDFLNKLAERKYEEKLAEEEKKIDVLPAEARKRGKDLITPGDIDDQHRNLLRLRGGQVRVDGADGPTLFKPLGAVMYCGAAMDVAPALQLAKDNGFLERTVLSLGAECFKAVKELKKAARPVVLPAELIYREVDPFTGEIRETFMARKLFDAGLLIALAPGPEDSLSERVLTYQAARCVRFGVPRDEALKAITLNPAKMLGLGDRLGSLEAGKDATLVVYSGDPLDFNSVVEKVFIDGILAYQREKDVRLQRLLSTGQDAKDDR